MEINMMKMPLNDIKLAKRCGFTLNKIETVLRLYQYLINEEVISIPD
jgi:hypothetical protein